ncbi:MAG: c-type cytochrome [Elusimicrobia bacterium]|nr:c-type cytochrome [Elusimicrobiota bacterium]
MSYRKLFYVANFLMLGVFIWALAADNKAEWKDYQSKYFQMTADNLEKQASAEKDPKKAADLRALAKKTRNSPLEIRQIIVGDLGRYDRCTTCHVAMDEYTNPTLKTPADWPNPYKGHPKVDSELVKAHPFTKFGCTACHEGQGLATTAADAHGHVLHWEHPMLSVKDGHIQGSCVKCHDNFETLKGAEIAAKGRALFKQHGCYGCHAINGWGQSVSVGLEAIADKPFERIAGYNYDRVRIDGKRLPESEWNIQNWILAHLTNDPQHVTPNDPFKHLNAEPIPPSGMANFSSFVDDKDTGHGELSRSDSDAIVAYLSGMTQEELIPYRWHVSGSPEREPKFADAKAHGHYVFQKYGCAGCHGLDAKQGRRRFNALGPGQKPYDPKMTDDEKFAEMEKGAEPTLPDLMGTYTHDELVKKIGNGVAASEAKKWDPDGPLPMVFMPVWKDKISKHEMDDLATWLLSTAKKDDSGF